MALKSFQRSSKAFNGSFTGLPRKLQGYFMDVSKVFWESFKEASKSLRVLQERLKGASREFSAGFKGF